MKALAEEALRALSPVFGMRWHSSVGRPSIPAGARLLKATLLMALYTVRSERMLCEQARIQPAFPLVSRHEHGRDDVRPDNVHEEPSASPRARRGSPILRGVVVAQADKAGLMSREHFTVDGTLIEAWASLKSFPAQRREARSDRPPPDDPGNPSVNFRGGEAQQRHARVDDEIPEARLARETRRAKESRMSYSQHVLMENRNGLIVDVRIDEAMGKAEVTNALQMLAELPERSSRRTIAGDKGFDTKEFVAWTRAMNVTPHVAKNEYPGRSSALDDRTTRHVGYAVEPTNSETRRGDLRVDQDRRELQAHAVQGSGADRVGVPLRWSCLQPAPNVAADTEDGMKWRRPRGQDRAAVSDLDRPARTCSRNGPLPRPLKPNSLQHPASGQENTTAALAGSRATSHGGRSYAC